MNKSFVVTPDVFQPGFGRTPSELVRSSIHPHSVPWIAAGNRSASPDLSGHEWLQASADARGLAVKITGTGSVVGIAFLDQPARYEDDPSAFGLSTLFHLACLNNGVSIAPGGLMALSTAVDGIP